MLKTGLFGVLFFASFSLQAAVQEQSEAGFIVKLDYQIQAPPQQVYAKLVHDVGDWWNPAHTFSGDAHDLSIDDKPMGCFCERLKNAAGGARHMEVIHVDYGKTLVMSGALGPLQPMPLAAVMSIQLKPAAAEATALSVTYEVGGYQPHGLTSLAPIVDSVVAEQFTRLKSYVETGKPEK
jgi:uncharacterized protein YndB with AHSA1/START domain